MHSATAQSEPIAAPPPGAWLRMLVTNGAVLAALAGLWWIGSKLENPQNYQDASRGLPYPVHVLILIGINITLAVSLQLINGIAGQFSLGHAGFMAVGAYLGGYAVMTYGAITTPDGDIVDFARPAGVLGYFAALLVVLAIAAAVIALIVTILRLVRRRRAGLGAAVLWALGVWFLADIVLAGSHADSSWFVWSRGIRALANLFDLLVAHWTSVTAPAWIPVTWHKPLTMLIAVLGGGAVAAVAGFIVGLPTLRLRGDYLAIATLGFGEIIRIAILNAQPLGGATGLSLPTYWNPPADGQVGHYVFPWAFGLAAVATVVVWRLKHSPKGRAIQAVRDDEIAAAAVGIDTTHHKVLAFVIGAMFAGMAGAVYAHVDGYLSTDSFGFMRSVELVVIVTLGGLGSIPGAIIAAIALTWLPELLRSPQTWIALPFQAVGATEPNLPDRLVRWFGWIGDNRMPIYALLLIVLMILRARGMLRVQRWWRRQVPPIEPLPLDHVEEVAR